MEWLTLEDALKEAESLTITVLIELTKPSGTTCHFVEINGIAEFKSLVGNLDKLVNSKKIIKYTVTNINDLHATSLNDFLQKARRK